jgi:hypothetical protein
MSLISISLDLAGSTMAKATIRQFSAGDLENTSEQYALLAQGLYDVELRFYEHLLKRGVALDQIFCIKTIGDEVWATVTIPDDPAAPETKRLILASIESALDVATHTVTVATPDKSVNWDGTDSAPTDALGMNWHYQYLPMKYYLDVIDHAADVSPKRRESFDGMYGFLETTLAAKYQMPPGDETRGEILHQISAGMYRAGGQVRVRSDFLGYEVDRFFRTTKAATPQAVTLGQNLAARLHLDPTQGRLPDSTTGHTTITPAALGAPKLGRVDDEWKVVRSDLPKESLPGCDEDYTTYHLFRSKAIAKIVKPGRRVPLKLDLTKALLERGGLYTPEPAPAPASAPTDPPSA